MKMDLIEGFEASAKRTATLLKSRDHEVLRAELRDAVILHVRGRHRSMDEMVEVLAALMGEVKLKHGSLCWLGDGAANALRFRALADAAEALQ